jgi:hypothetical protein
VTEIECRRTPRRARTLCGPRHADVQRRKGITRHLPRRRAGRRRLNQLDYFELSIHSERAGRADCADHVSPETPVLQGDARPGRHNHKVGTIGVVPMLAQRRVCTRLRVWPRAAGLWLCAASFRFPRQQLQDV